MPVVKKCKICNKEFKTKPYWVKIGKGIYCSNQCRHSDRRSGSLIKCSICGQESYRALERLARSKSGKFFCSKSCQTKWRNTEFVGPKHANWKHGMASYQSVLQRHKILGVCTLCLTKDKRLLAVHHVDKNRKNNVVKNLAWLCHNCHFLVHHDNLERQRFSELHAERDKMVPMV